MNFKNIVFFTGILFLATFFLYCKKDPDTRQEKIILYQLLCPRGSEACYNDCANQTGISDGNITGSEYKSFQSCTSLCDSYCNLSFLLISKE